MIENKYCLFATAGISHFAVAVFSPLALRMHPALGYMTVIDQPACPAPRWPHFLEHLFQLGPRPAN
jgi:hypothetical protein